LAKGGALRCNAKSSLPALRKPDGHRGKRQLICSAACVRVRQPEKTTTRRLNK
jgi:hypothetical protein